MLSVHMASVNGARAGSESLVKAGLRAVCMYVQACLHNNPLIFPLTDSYSNIQLP